MASHADEWDMLTRQRSDRTALTVPTTERQTLIGVYFDVKAAFPGAKRKHLEAAIRAHPELEGSAADISSRADTRTVYMEWDCLQSPEKTFVSGFDQGDPASPALWQLVMEWGLSLITNHVAQNNDMVRRYPESYRADPYVDDGYAGIRDQMTLKDARKATQDIAAALDQAEAEWGFRIPKDKITGSSRESSHPK